LSKGIIWWSGVYIVLEEAVDYGQPVTSYKRHGWVPGSNFTVSYYDEHCEETGGINPAACDEGKRITYPDPFPPPFLKREFLAWKFLNKPWKCFVPDTSELVDSGVPCADNN